LKIKEIKCMLFNGIQVEKGSLLGSLLVELMELKLLELELLKLLELNLML
jgi:hypothetical protein